APAPRGGSAPAPGRAPASTEPDAAAQPAQPAQPADGGVAQPSHPVDVGVALELKGITRRFGELVAVDQVDLKVEPGQFVVMLGPSGSGKTTILRLVAGIEKLDEGSITLGGKVLADGRLHLPPERRGLAMVFQDYALWPHLSVLANVAYALRRLRLPGAEADRRAKAMLERVGLSRYAEGWPHQLSGGEQQRVALARALVARPGLLLCDEPLSNLDADLRERLRLEIATLAREAGTTVVYITHDQSEAFALADRVGVLDHGHLVQFDRPEVVYHRPATPFVARFTGLAGELSGALGPSGGDGRVSVETAVGAVLATGVAGVDLLSSAAERVTVLVRPAAIRLVGRAGAEVGRPAGDGRAGAEVGRPAWDGRAGDPRAGDGENLSGQVRDVAYRGRGYDHVVALADGTLLCGIFDAGRFPRGTQVGVGLDPAGCFAFPTEPKR
ncbi:MAG: ABC transporter ATP-binding protein, partial [Acidimicrobiales bacterium]